MELREEQTLAEVRPIEVITSEILFYKQQAGGAILEIGRRLNEAKAQLSHGEWLPWLAEKVEFSDATANRFMRLAREYANPSPVTDLGVSKALQLLALPENERAEFAAEKHLVNGEEKTVEEMSKRELAQAIRERDEAQEKAAGLERAVEEIGQQTADLQKQLEEANRKAGQAADQAAGELKTLREQLEELKTAPRAVEKVVDEEAISAAVTAAKQEEEQRLKAKIEQAERAAKKAAEDKAKAEQALAAAKVAQEQADAVAAREKETLAEQVEVLQKKLAVAASSEVTVFKLHFEQGQTTLAKMRECLGRIADSGDGETAGKLQNAMVAMLQAALDGVR